MQTTKYTAGDEMELMGRIWSPAIADNPLAFVLLVYPWRQEGTPLANFAGPRKWQRNILRKLTEHIKANKPLKDFKMFRHATSSGRGIGKSALVSWIVHWMISTRIGSTTIVSANTENQLSTKTWPELTKWLGMAVNAHWFEPSATRVTPAKWLTEAVKRDLNRDTRLWAAQAQLWSAENPDAYAGTHNFDGVLLVFDEASGIDDTIWAVSAGFFTENTPHRFWLAFSNPRRTSGYFFETFHSKREFWQTEIVDARTVEGTDKQAYQQIIDEYGPDSHQAHVEVYGQFPSASDDQFIGSTLVQDAMSRPPAKDESAPIVVGVDPARFGSDSTVIAIRQGRDIIGVRKFKGADTMEVVGHVIGVIEEFKPALVVIDEGGLGAGVVDRLKEQRYKIRGVNFGNKSKHPIMWGNMRAQMWGDMREWLKTAHLPTDRFLKMDLTGPMQKPDSRGTIFLESKKDMKARGLASPDCFVAGTRIKTPAGEQPIEQIRKGDVVCTPFGPARVFAAWATETESLTTAAMSNGACLVGTGKHKVFVWGQGEKRLDTLTVTDRLEPYGSWRFWLCRVLIASGTQVYGTEFRQVVATTSRAGRLTPNGCCTAVSGAMLTGLYRKICTSITATVTGGTTTFPIWIWWPQRNTCPSTRLRDSGAAISSPHPERRSPLRLCGTHPTKVLRGTESRAAPLGPIGSPSARIALSATASTRHTSAAGPNIALWRAQVRSATGGILQMSGRVRGAAKTLWRTVTAQRLVVPVSVQTESVAPTRVFNLTLDKHNAYYANGVLVFNCADAIAVTFAFPVAHREAHVDRTRRQAYAPSSVSTSWMGS